MKSRVVVDVDDNDDDDDNDDNDAIGDLMSIRVLFLPHCLNARAADALNIVSTLFMMLEVGRYLAFRCTSR